VNSTWGATFTVLNRSVDARLKRQCGKIRAGGNYCADTGSLVTLKRNIARGVHVAVAGHEETPKPVDVAR
jgi:hypothetical protein